MPLQITNTNMQHRLHLPLNFRYKFLAPILSCIGAL